MKIFLNASIIALALVISSCKESKTNRQMFDDNIDKYIEAAASSFIEKGMDTLSANSLCRCLMEKMYDIDSTFFLREFNIGVQNHTTNLINTYSQELFKDCSHLIDNKFLHKSIFYK